MRDCDNCKHRETWAYAVPCSNCYGASNWEEIKQTNADRIRAMSDEELAEFLGKTKAFGYNHADMSEYFTAEFAEWLKKEVTTNSKT